MVLALWSSGLRAQDVDIDALKFTATQGTRYDSNLFRRNTDVRSETVATTTAGIELDKRYSLQRVEFDANLASHRYRSNDYLNYNALNYRAVWHWSVTPRLHGTLSRTRTEAINNFDYFYSTDRNLRTDEITAFNAEGELGRDWRLLGGVQRARRDNERPTAEQGDYAQRDVSAGVRRLFTSGSSISYRYLDGQGDYFNRLPNVSAQPTAFVQREHEVRVVWAASGKTRINATAAYVDRKHQALAVRDYAGARGNLSVQWAATGKSGMQLTLARDIGSYQTNTSSYSTSNRLSLYPYWSVGPHTVLYASLDAARYAFEGTLPGMAGNNRRDRSTGASVGVRWEPFNALSLDATLGREQRDSNLDGFDYTNTSARVAAKFSF